MTGSQGHWRRNAIFRKLVRMLMVWMVVHSLTSIASGAPPRTLVLVKRQTSPSPDPTDSTAGSTGQCSNPGPNFPGSFNCTKAAIEQFPRPLMGQYTRAHGGIVVHLLVTLYMFLALAIICDDYFIPSLEKAGDVLDLQKDVAGATLMAAGSSAPEFATAVIGVFVVQDDIGLGAVVGSAVFNIAFVVGICGLFAGKVVYVSAWPMLRDCFFYLLSIAALLAFISNEVISWPEATSMILLYGVYICMMHFNPLAESWFIRKFPSLYRHIGMIDPSLDKIITSSTVEESQECSALQQMLDFVSAPLHFAFWITVPDCRKTAWENWYALTFVMSCFWIGVCTYLLVWMITIIGFTLSIPDTVMGLTLLAAGVSVPDAIASYLVVKKDYGDMAVSNAVGSNVFDILLCLGLPWFLRTAIVCPGSTVAVQSKGLMYSTVALFSTVVFLIGSTHLNGWKLDRRHGCLMMLCYLVFMVFSTLYELNIIPSGSIPIPSCPSDY